MTDDQVQELADKYLDAPFVRISEIVREAYLAGEKAGLEEAARLCDTWQLFFPGRTDIAEVCDEVADKLGIEIRAAKKEKA